MPSPLSINGSPPNHRLLLGLAFTALLVAAGMWIFYRDSDDESPEAGTSTTEEQVQSTTATSEGKAQDSTTTVVVSVPDTAPGLGDGDVSELVAFVEVTRNLEFATLVEVLLQDEAQFQAELGDYLDGELDVEALAESERIYRALGLTPPDQDIEPLLREFLLRRTLGYYEADTGTVRVIKGLGPLTESVLVHELTHALEDQNFDLDTERFEGREDESQLAFESVVEGNAAFVESTFVEQLSDSEQTELRLAQAALAPPPPLSEPVLTLRVPPIPALSIQLAETQCWMMPLSALLKRASRSVRARLSARRRLCPSLVFRPQMLRRCPAASLAR